MPKRLPSKRAVQTHKNVVRAIIEQLLIGSTASAANDTPTKRASIAVAIPCKRRVERVSVLARLVFSSVFVSGSSCSASQIIFPPIKPKMRKDIIPA